MQNKHTAPLGISDMKLDLNGWAYPCIYFLCTCVSREELRLNLVAQEANPDVNAVISDPERHRECDSQACETVCGDTVCFESRRLSNWS